MANGLRPMARAARTNSRSLRPRISARASRLIVIQADAARISTRAAVLRPEQGREDHQQQDPGEGEEGVHDAHQQGVEPAPAQGRGRADGDAQDQRESGREEADRQRDPPAPEHPRPEVAPELVAAQQVEAAVGHSVRGQVEHPAGGQDLGPAQALDPHAFGDALDPVRQPPAAVRQPDGRERRCPAAGRRPRRGRAARRDRSARARGPPPWSAPAGRRGRRPRGGCGYASRTRGSTAACSRSASRLPRTTRRAPKRVMPRISG